MKNKDKNLNNIDYESRADESDSGKWNVSEEESQSEETTFEEVNTDEVEVPPAKKPKEAGNSNLKKYAIGGVVLAALGVGGYIASDLLLTEEVEETQDVEVVEPTPKPKPKPKKPVVEEKDTMTENNDFGLETTGGGEKDDFALEPMDNGMSNEADPFAQSVKEQVKPKQPTQTLPTSKPNVSQLPAIEAEEPFGMVEQQVEEKMPVVNKQVEPVMPMVMEQPVNVSGLEDFKAEMKQALVEVDGKFTKLNGAVETAFADFGKNVGGALNNLNGKINAVGKKAVEIDTLKTEIEALRSQIKVLEEKSAACGCGVATDKSAAKTKPTTNKETKIVTEEMESGDSKPMVRPAKVTKDIVKKPTQQGNYIEFVGKRKIQTLESKMPKVQEDTEMTGTLKRELLGREGSGVRLRSISNNIAWIEKGGITTTYQIGESFNGVTIGRIDSENGVFDTNGNKMFDPLK